MASCTEDTVVIAEIGPEIVGIGDAHPNEQCIDAGTLMVEVTVFAASGDVIFGPMELPPVTTAGDIAKSLVEGDRAPQLLFESVLVDHDQDILQICRTKSDSAPPHRIEFMAFRCMFEGFEHWDSHGAVVEGGRFEKTDVTPDFSWAIGNTAHTAGVTTWRLRKTKGNEYGFRLGVGCDCRIADMDLNYREGYEFFCYTDIEGSLYRFEPYGFANLGSGVEVAKCGSELEIELDCDNHMVTFRTGNNSTPRTIENLPSKPFNLCICAWKDAVGNAWEVSMA